MSKKFVFERSKFGKKFASKTKHWVVVVGSLQIACTSITAMRKLKGKK
jgi:hypothetical protein